MKSASVRRSAGRENGYDLEVAKAQKWFAQHVSMDGKPYTLDVAQTKAVIDAHLNTLVTARAGSGKTRVIVAKVAYLIGHHLASLDEIAIFMFNRAAAAEVNQRIAAMRIDSQSLTEISPRQTERPVASTFHKFALNTVKQSGMRPKIISEAEQSALIQNLLNQSLQNRRASLHERQELLSLVSNFITRAGQKYPGQTGLQRLKSDVDVYCNKHANQPEFRRNCYIHRLCFQIYQKYLTGLKAPLIDFNQLMHLATKKLQRGNFDYKYIMIDEYQDFSYLFFALTQALRKIYPQSHLFCVGDDWQAINRFAGSDVDYFLNFAQYFSEDQTNIALATNYRSCRKIVERANRFMLQNYDPTAIPAIPQNSKSGKIYMVNPAKIKFDPTDIDEDALGDGRYQLILQEVLGKSAPLGAVKLLKTVTKIIARNSNREIMLLHRHNFTSFEGVTLAVFTTALQKVLNQLGIISPENFAKQIRCMTMHKSKGLESEVVILLELNREIVQSTHPHATISEIFGDTLVAERADQQRLIYVALTRAKQKLYLLSSDQKLLV